MRMVTIERKTGYYGRIRALRLFVDDEYVGKLRCGECMDIPIPENARELYGKMDWGRTEPFDLTDIEDGAGLVITSWITMNLLVNLGILRIPMRILRAEDVR